MTRGLARLADISYRRRDVLTTEGATSPTRARSGELRGGGRAVTRTGVLLVCAALVAGTLSGCGGGGASDAEQVVDDYLEAIADGDGERACEQLTEDVQRRLIDAAPAEVGATDCSAAAAAYAGTLSQERRQQLRHTEYGGVTVDGDRATVSLRSGGTAELTKTDGGAYSPRRWRISGGLEL